MKSMNRKIVLVAFVLCVARAGFASFGPGDAESYRAAGIVDDDTVAFLTLDDANLSSGMVLTNFAYGTHKQTAKLGINTGIVTQPGTSGDLPGTGVRRLASLDENIFENAGYIHFQTNLNAQKSGCVYVTDTDYDLFGGDSFTIEGFHRFNEPPGGEGAKDTQFVLGRHASQWNLLASINGTKLKFQHWHNEIDGIVTNSINASGTSTTVVRDGCWHHLAYVYDGDAQTATLYVDYQKQVTLKNVKFPACEKKYSEYLMLGSAYYATSSAYQANSLDLDEVRITRRVLAPREFLASEYVANAGKTLFWTGFEEDAVADIVPWPYLTLRSKCTLPSSKSPTISDEVPFSFGVKDDRGVLRDKNKHALQIIKGGYLTWKDDLMLQHRNFDKLTLELFAKSTDAAGGSRYSSVADFTVPSYDRLSLSENRK